MRVRTTIAPPMRLHVALLGVAIAGFAGWLALWPRADHPDLVRARDALVASDALVVDFDGNGVGGYRFTWLKDRGWVWELTDARGTPYADALIYDGEQHLLRIGDGCHVPVFGVRLPVVPGVTVAPRLARQAGVDEQGDIYTYSVGAGFAVRPDYQPGLAELEITEDFSTLRADGTVRASTGSGPGYLWRGDYTIVRASEADVARAVDALTDARASDYAEIVLRQQVFGNILWGGVSGPISVVVAEDCPDQPVQLGAGAYGGQAEGLRAIPVPYGLTYGENPVFRNATTPSALGGPLGEVSVKTTETVIVSLGPASGVRLYIASCTSRPWFVC